MKRVLILGPGGSGKSTLGKQLSKITGLRLIEIDKIFWQPGLAATPHYQWIAMQRQILAENNEWIIDGDLGPYDVIEVRLLAADAIIFLDLSLAQCAWRAFRRARERADFWLWLLQYHRKGGPLLMKAIAERAPAAKLHLLRSPKEVEQFITGLKVSKIAPYA